MGKKGKAEKEEGIVLGRPVGRCSSVTKLTGKEQALREMLSAGMKKTRIARIFHVNRMTVDKFIRTRLNPEWMELQKEAEELSRKRQQERLKRRNALGAA